MHYLEAAPRNFTTGVLFKRKDFADALFSVWLGPNSVQEDLKKALLGGAEARAAEIFM